MATINLNDSSPPAPPGKQNNKWQAGAAGSSTRDTSNYAPDFVGDSAAGGVSGAVPGPRAGDAAQGMFLSASGGWAIPGDLYELPIFLLGIQTVANQILIRVRPSRAIVLPIALARSTFTATANATGTTIFSVRKNDVEFGTITVAAGGTNAVFAASSSARFNGTTDILSVVGPASADATLANIGILLTGMTLVASRFEQFDEEYWITTVQPMAWFTRYPWRL